MGTVRIFLAPKFDERGTDMLFRDQRLLFIELDKFIVARNNFCFCLLEFFNLKYFPLSQQYSKPWSKYNS